MTMAPQLEASSPVVDADVSVAKQLTEVLEPQEPAPSDAQTHEDNNAEVNPEAEATEDAAATLSDHASRKRVQFEDADVVEFEPTMWTATVASDGVPVGMSTTVRRRTRRRLDSYESEREMTRVDRQVYMEHGYLEPEERLDILELTGHALSEMSRVENDNLRINRERWESNEYDLMYQYGLGEVPVLEMSDDEEMMAANMLVDDSMLCADDSDDGEYFFNSRNLLMDADVRFAVEEMDAYGVDPNLYENLSVDYASDCILGDDTNSEVSNDLPYSEDSFESPYSAMAPTPIEMSSSPSDVSDASDCLLAACAVRAKQTSAPAVPADNSANVVVAV